MTIVNPNNPDGAVMAREHVLELQDRLASQGSTLVVDEAFADVLRMQRCGRGGHARTSPPRRAAFVRQVLRPRRRSPGFMIAAPEIVSRLRDLLGDWPISADALEAGLAAYSDTAWADRTRARLKRAAQHFDKLLESAGFTIVGGTSLFRLARADDAADRFQRLLQAGILARPSATIRRCSGSACPKARSRGNV